MLHGQVTARWQIPTVRLKTVVYSYTGGGGRTVVGIVEQGVRGSAPTKNVWGDLRGIGRRRGERGRRDERGERGGRGKRGERDDRGEAMAMSKRCVVQGRQVHGGVSVGEGTRAANRKQGQIPE